MIRRLVAILAFALVTFGLACGGTSASNSTGSSGSSAAATAAPSPTPLPLVVVKTLTVGGKDTQVLTDTAGLTLYIFTPDKGGKVTCTGGCLAAWPALLLPAGATVPTGGPGIKGTFSTVANPDGKGTQVLYNSWPLYYYIKDKQPGDVTGQGVGGKWFVATPDQQP